ncbi:hypothetical protein C8R45DRAFT_1067933 [Mycena sanguinolenta]|nr:hypothetical protein C8R45DRAFT_1067933 [Mycena sanguinolenta]
MGSGAVAVTRLSDVYTPLVVLEPATLDPSRAATLPQRQWWLYACQWLAIEWGVVYVRQPNLSPSPVHRTTRRRRRHPAARGLEAERHDARPAQAGGDVHLPRTWLREHEGGHPNSQRGEVVCVREELCNACKRHEQLHTNYAMDTISSLQGWTRSINIIVIIILRCSALGRRRGVPADPGGEWADARLLGDRDRADAGRWARGAHGCMYSTGSYPGSPDPPPPPALRLLGMTKTEGSWANMNGIAL